MRADQHPSTPADEIVTLRRSELDAILARLDSSSARLDALERRPEATEDARVHAAPADDRATPGTVGRRRALVGLAGVAAAGAAVVAGPTRPAAAANGDHVVIGSTANAGSLATGLTVTSTAAAYGIGVTDISLLSPLTVKPSVFGHARFQAFSTGVLGLAEGNQSTGVTAMSEGWRALFARSISGTAVYAHSTNASAVYAETQSPSSAAITAHATHTDGTSIFVRGRHPIQLDANIRSGEPTEAPNSTRLGTLQWVRDHDDTGSPNALWACVGNGSAGSWRVVAGSRTAGSFHLLPTPVRVYDSRTGTPPAQGPKTLLPAGNVARTIDLTHNNSEVPAGARAALVTVLLVNAASGAGNFTIWANDKPKPLSNTMVWGGSAGRFTTLAVTGLDPQARVKVDASLATNLVLDVVGYYR